MTANSSSLRSCQFFMTDTIPPVKSIISFFVQLFTSFFGPSDLILRPVWDMYNVHDWTDWIGCLHQITITWFHHLLISPFQFHHSPKTTERWNHVSFYGLTGRPLHRSPINKDFFQKSWCSKKIVIIEYFKLVWLSTFRLYPQSFHSFFPSPFFDSLEKSTFPSSYFICMALFWVRLACSQAFFGPSIIPCHIYIPTMLSLSSFPFKWYITWL